MILRFRLLIVLLIVALGALFPSLVLAQPYYYRWQSGVVNFTCTLGADVTINFSSQPVEWDLPAGASYTLNYITNGVVNPSGPFPLAAGTGTMIYNQFTDNAAAYPVDYSIRMDTIIGGQVVYTSSLSTSCAADSTGPATVTNIDLSVSPTNPTGSTANFAFTDGRLNPQPYAPVVLFCGGDNNQTLSAYAVNGSAAGLVWTYEMDGDSAPETDSIIASEGGSTLHHFANGRYGVEARQADGKGYLFIFGGCPTIGVPEVYVTDPFSGAFVRTE